jgi:hypothetical protein
LKRKGDCRPRSWKAQNIWIKITVTTIKFYYVYSGVMHMDAEGCRQITNSRNKVSAE